MRCSTRHLTAASIAQLSHSVNPPLPDRPVTPARYCVLLWTVTQMWDMPATKMKEFHVRRAVSYATGKSLCVPSTQWSQEQAMVRPSATWCLRLCVCVVRW
jgi:hypothetical protein